MDVDIALKGEDLHVWQWGIPYTMLTVGWQWYWQTDPRVYPQIQTPEPLQMAAQCSSDAELALSAPPRQRWGQDPSLVLWNDRQGLQSFSWLARRFEGRCAQGEPRESWHTRRHQSPWAPCEERDASPHSCTTSLCPYGWHHCAESANSWQLWGHRHQRPCPTLEHTPTQAPVKLKYVYT